MHLVTTIIRIICAECHCDRLAAVKIPDIFSVYFWAVCIDVTMFSRRPWWRLLLINILKFKVTNELFAHAAVSSASKVVMV